MSAPLTIIGSGMAGIGLLRALRALDAERPVTLITADSGDDYSKPLLSTGFAKRLPPERLAARSALQVAEQLDAVVRTHTRVEAIDTAARTLMIGRETLPWSELVLATGAAPAAPFPVADALAGRVFTINDLEDYRAFHAALEALGRPGRIAIVGAGLVGCEFANDLLAGGHAVSLVAPEAAPLPRLLPEPLGRALGEAFEERSEEHTSELQSCPHLVCRLLLEKKKIGLGRLISPGLGEIRDLLPISRARCLQHRAVFEGEKVVHLAIRIGVSPPHETVTAPADV